MVLFTSHLALSMAEPSLPSAPTPSYMLMAPRASPQPGVKGISTLMIQRRLRLSRFKRELTIFLHQLLSSWLLCLGNGIRAPQALAAPPCSPSFPPTDHTLVHILPGKKRNRCQG